jgi:hypothetical protein
MPPPMMIVFGMGMGGRMRFQVSGAKWHSSSHSLGFHRVLFIPA